MSKLDDDIRAADSLGISYGYYIAMTYDPNAEKILRPAKKKRNTSPRRFSDNHAFSLWQEGKSDTEIAAACGVSRQCIQKWRDQLELPLLSKTNANPQKYRLDYLQDGTVFIIQSDEL